MTFMINLTHYTHYIIVMIHQTLRKALSIQIRSTFRFAEDGKDGKGDANAPPPLTSADERLNLFNKFSGEVKSNLKSS